MLAESKDERQGLSREILLGLLRQFMERWWAEDAAAAAVQHSGRSYCCSTKRNVCLAEREREDVGVCFLTQRGLTLLPPVHANTTHLSLRSSFSSPSRLRALGRTCPSLPVTWQRAILSGTERQAQTELIHTPAVAALHALRGETLWGTRAKTWRFLQAGEKKLCCRNPNHHTPSTMFDCHEKEWIDFIVIV